MTTTTLPSDFRPLAVDPRRPLPLATSVSVTAGTFRLLVVATPADLAAAVGADLDTPWFDGRRDVDPFPAPAASDLAAALGAPATDPFAATRPTLVVASSSGVHWARPLVVGRVQRVVDESGSGLLFEVLVSRCELMAASLVRIADVGAVLTIGVRDPLVAVPPAPAPTTEEDPHVALL